MKAAAAVIVALAGVAHAKPAKDACGKVVAPNRDAVHHQNGVAAALVNLADHDEVVRGAHVGVVVRAGECLGRQHVPFEQLRSTAPLPTLLVTRPKPTSR